MISVLLIVAIFAAHTIGHGWTIGVVVSGLVSPRASQGDYELEFPTVGAAASVDWVLGDKGLVRLGLDGQAMYWLGGWTCALVRADRSVLGL